MVGRRREVSEEVIVRALGPHGAIHGVVAMIDDMAREVGKAKRQAAPKAIDPALARNQTAVYGPLARRCASAASSRTTGRWTGSSAAAWRPSDGRRAESAAKRALGPPGTGASRQILERGVRLDGRASADPPIWCEVGVVPRTLGGLHEGETGARDDHAGHVDDRQKIGAVGGEFYKRFMLHYNFRRSPSARWPS